MMDDKKNKIQPLIFGLGQINSSVIAEKSIKEKGIVAVFNPKVKMAQIGGNDIIGERILSEPIIDKFGNTFYLKHEDRIIKKTFTGEINLNELEVSWLKKFNDEID